MVTEEGRGRGTSLLRNCFVSVVAHLFPFFLRFTFVVSTVGGAEAEAEAEGKGAELREGIFRLLIVIATDIKRERARREFLFSSLAHAATELDNKTSSVGAGRDWEERTERREEVQEEERAYFLSNLHPIQVQPVLYRTCAVRDGCIV